MKKTRRNGRIKLYIVVIVVLLLAGIGIIVSQRNATKAIDPTTAAIKVSPGDESLCSRNNIPVKSCGRAVQAGMYCPSWDAKPGQIVSDFCIKIKLTQ